MALPGFQGFERCRQDLAMSQEEELTFVADALNKIMLSISTTLEKSMTLALVSINKLDGQGCYLNAGHNQIYLIHGDHSSQSILCPGTPLGMAEQPIFGTKQFQLNEDDFLFLFTDGLIENCGPNGERFPTRELKQLLSQAADPEELREAIIAKMESLWQDQPPQDDVAFVILKRELKDQNKKLNESSHVNGASKVEKAG